MDLVSLNLHFSNAAESYISLYSASVCCSNVDSAQFCFYCCLIAQMLQLRIGFCTIKQAPTHVNFGDKIDDVLRKQLVEKTTRT